SDQASLHNALLFLISVDCMLSTTRRPHVSLSCPREALPAVPPPDQRAAAKSAPRSGSALPAHKTRAAPPEEAPHGTTFPTSGRQAALRLGLSTSLRLQHPSR